MAVRLDLPSRLLSNQFMHELNCGAIKESHQLIFMLVTFSVLVSRQRFAKGLITPTP